MEVVKSTVAVSAGAIAVYGAFCLGSITGSYIRRSHLMPPSPPSWRLFGHFLPRIKSFLVITKWIKQHGPVITIRSGFKNIVIIGSYRAAVRIMIEQSESLVDRPRMIATGEILSGAQSIIFAPFGDRFRRMRRALVSYLSCEGDDPYQLQHQMAKNIVLAILNDSCNFQKNVTTQSATMIMKMAYGKNTSAYATDTEAPMIRRILETFRIAMRGSYQLVEYIPCLRHLPWYGRELKQQFEISRRLYADQLDQVKTQINDNPRSSGPSFAKYLLNNSKRHLLTDDETAFLTGNLLLTGSHLTASAICTVLMAAARFHDEQVKVHAEIDEIVKGERAPTYADVDNLPILRAFVIEALRWRPVLPNGMPHLTTAEVSWGKYHIPAGTTVIGNHFAISRDPERYPDPDTFNPERWTEDMIKYDSKFFIYGFGQRACPAQKFADRSIFLSVALILWAFDIRVDADPEDGDVDVDAGIIINESEILADDECVTAAAAALDFRMRVPESDVRSMLTSSESVSESVSVSELGLRPGLESVSVSVSVSVSMSDDCVSFSHEME